MSSKVISLFFLVLFSSCSSERNLIFVPGNPSIGVVDETGIATPIDQHDKLLGPVDYDNITDLKFY